MPVASWRVGLALAALLLPFLSAAATTCGSLKTPAPARSVCGTHGRLLRPVLLTPIYQAASLEACASSCLSNSACKAFLYNANNGDCSRYREEIARQSFNPNPSRPTRFWDAACFTTQPLAAKFRLRHNGVYALENPDTISFFEADDDSYTTYTIEAATGKLLNNLNGITGRVYIEDRYDNTIFFANPSDLSPFENVVCAIAPSGQFTCAGSGGKDDLAIVFPQGGRYLGLRAAEQPSDVIVFADCPVI